MQRSGEDGAAAEIDEDELRAVYEAGEVPVRAICAQYGLTKYQLDKKRIVRRWKTRPQVARPGPNQGRGAVYPQTLLRRILRLIDEHLKAREAAGDAPAPLTGPELTLVATLTKAAEAMCMPDVIRRGGAAAGPRRRERDRAAVGGGFATPEEARAADVAFMRAEIKRRIAILRRSAGLDGADGPAEGA